MRSSVCTCLCGGEHTFSSQLNYRFWVKNVVEKLVEFFLKIDRIC